MKDEIPISVFAIYTRAANSLKETLPKGSRGRVEKRQIPEQFVLLVEVPSSPHVHFTKFTDWCRKYHLIAEEIVKL